MAEDVEAMFSVAEVARTLSVTPQTVRQWIEKGHLEGVKVGVGRGFWRIRSGALKEFLYKNYGPVADGTQLPEGDGGGR